MLDALLADQLKERTGGLLVRCGSLVFACETPERDRRDLLSESEYPVVVWSSLETRDEQFSLTGFSSMQRRDLYLGVRQVSGIGRHSALKVLDGGKTGDILRAVASQDKEFFRTVPGLGDKRIQAVIQSLQKRFAGHLPQKVSVPVQWIVEAREALQSQGLPEDEAELKVLAEVKASSPKTLEQLIQSLDR